MVRKFNFESLLQEFLEIVDNLEKLEICVDNEFTIYKKIKSAKGTVKVEWE